MVTPIAEPFFAAARENVLLIQKCPRDGFFFYPRSRCPHCLQADWAWQRARPSGRIHSYTVDRMGHEPGLRPQVPFVIAIVDLDDGPRIVGNVVDATFEGLRVGLNVEVFFLLADGFPLTRFRPATA